MHVVLALVKAALDPHLPELAGGTHARAFHDRVLEDGALPLVLLRSKIERWITAGGSL
ncbi:MAG: hypothetical protein ACT4O1_16990 [Gemmatimonadota bacterium]